jgi:hypothetical protein
MAAGLDALEEVIRARKSLRARLEDEVRRYLDAPEGSREEGLAILAMTKTIDEIDRLLQDA